MEIGIVGAMFIAFLVLKLAGVIAWSWWWVTAPLWISGACTLLLLLSMFCVIWLKKHNEANRRRSN